MKIYGKENTMCSLVGESDPKTFHKWVCLFIDALSNLEGIYCKFLCSLSFF